MHSFLARISCNLLFASCHVRFATTSSALWKIFFAMKSLAELIAGIKIERADERLESVRKNNLSPARPVSRDSPRERRRYSFIPSFDADRK